ncbi:MAG: hypothetical protein QOI21_713 [Actinomycetota bacterium]|jgi:hypothetical protein|nr:hypothetical protein [Actinomycetota bacterium]
MMFQPAQPGVQYYALPPSMIVAIRKNSATLGALTTAVGFALSILMPVMGYQLPTSYDGANVVTVGMGTFASVCLLLSGVSLIVSRSLASTGYIKRTGANLLRGLIAGLCAAALFASVIFLFFFINAVTSSGDYTGQTQLNFTPLITLYALLPVVASFLIIFNLVVVQKLFFPSRRRVRKHSGHNPAHR